jgi:threonine dehydrogenase-like Zn-dependent dehydrogenase
MKAFRMHGIGRATFDDVAEPSLSPGDLLLEPVLSGVCSTDVHIYTEGALVDAFPRTLGHEVIGRVVAQAGVVSTSPYGDRRPKPQVGDLVCVEPLLPCGGCRTCLRGAANLCVASTHLGISADGCFADLVRVPGSRALVLPSGVAPYDAIFVEPLACALNFLDKCEVGPGATVAVLGAGPAGLLTAMAAAAAGCSVVVSDPEPARREVALRLAAVAAVDPHAADLQAVLDEVTAGQGPDAIIEVTGNPAAVVQAVDIAPFGARLVLAGVCGEAHGAIDTNAIVLKELRVLGAVASCWQFDRALRLITSGRINVSELVSLVAPWETVEEQLLRARDDRSVLKLLLEHPAAV